MTLMGALKGGACQPAVENTMQRSRIGACVLGIGLFSAGPAHTTALELKTGLWERSVTTMTELAPSHQQDLSELAPDTRAKIEQARSGSIPTGRHTRVTQECVTPAMLEKWSAFAHNETANAQCKRTIVNENSKRLKATLSCDGGKTKGDIDFAVSGEQLKGSVVMVSHEQDFDRTVRQEIVGKWLGDRCAASQPSKSGQ